MLPTDPITLTLLLALVFLVAAAYSSVGHGGASGYLAALSFFGLAPAAMAPSALCLNLLVAGTSFVSFKCAAADSVLARANLDVAALPSGMQPCASEERPLAHSREEQQILSALDSALQRPGVHGVLEAIMARVHAKLASDPEATLAWEPVPLETYGGKLPELIKSSWVFVLRAGTTSGAERHPNSHQRMMAYRGTGDMQTWESRSFRSNVLVSDPTAPLEQRWVSIPVNVWHKPVMGPEDWMVVSFHTAAADELIEERGNPEQSSETHQETYLSRSDTGFLGAR